MPAPPITAPTIPNPFANLPVFNFKKEIRKPIVVPITLNFAMQASYTLDFQQLAALKYIDDIQTMYVDNSNNIAPVTVTCQGVGQSITVAPGKQGTYPLFVFGGPVFTFTSNKSVATIKIFLSNIPQPYAEWDSIASPYLTGTIRANGTQTAVGPNNIVSIADGNGMVITDIEIYLSNDASLSAAGDQQIKLAYADGQPILWQTNIWLPAAAITTAIGAQTLVQLTNIAWYTKIANVSLQLSMTTALATGKLTWNVGYSETSILHP